jgi:hypothetical protein
VPILLSPGGQGFSIHKRNAESASKTLLRMIRRIGSFTNALSASWASFAQNASSNGLLRLAKTSPTCLHLAAGSFPFMQYLLCYKLLKLVITAVVPDYSSIDVL